MNNFNPNENFYYYLYWMTERMNIFWKRYNGETEDLTEDPILSTYKFTNVYRSLDRVSQYLIKNVIYNKKGLANDYDSEDIFFRILLFKHFNKIETWEILEEEFGDIILRKGIINDISEFLKKKIDEGSIVYNNAYMMTSAFLQGKKYGYLRGRRKHEMYLEIFKKELFEEKHLYKILSSKSLKEMTEVISKATTFADFTTMQLAIDLNYSPLLNFDENDFIIAGVGAQRGIERTFDNVDKKNYLGIIKGVQENLPMMLEQFELDFKPLPNRMPTLIDLQNVFCESDKYMRGLGIETEGKEIKGKKIKNYFKPKNDKIDYLFPPKWEVRL